MKRALAPVTPPIPPELAGAIDADQALISYLLMQRMGANPDRVIAFAKWEKRIKAELEELQRQAARVNSDHPEASAVAGGGQ